MNDTDCDLARLEEKVKALRQQFRNYRKATEKALTLQAAGSEHRTAIWLAVLSLVVSAGVAIVTFAYHR